MRLRRRPQRLAAVPLNTTHPTGRLRQLLIDLAGDRCHACGLRTAVVVDHDHFTGLVRGLLCTHCNAWIDRCPHLTNYPWANYFNAPPAQHLGIRHPQAAAAQAAHQARIEYLGFDPFVH